MEVEIYSLKFKYVENVLPLWVFGDCEGSRKVAHVQYEEVFVWIMFTLASVSSKP